MVLPQVVVEVNQGQVGAEAQEEVEVRDLRLLPLILDKVKPKEVVCRTKNRSTYGRIGLFATSVGNGANIKPKSAS